jgi:hypothetical protein
MTNIFTYKQGRIEIQPIYLVQSYEKPRIKFYDPLQTKTMMADINKADSHHIICKTVQLLLVCDKYRYFVFPDDFRYKTLSEQL